jgi:hypothetical protein
MKSHGKIDDLSSKRSRISPTWNVTKDGAFTRLTTYIFVDKASLLQSHKNTRAIEHG